MLDSVMHSNAFSSLKMSMDSYGNIQDATWTALQKHCRCKSLIKGEMLYKVGNVPSSFSYVYSGLLRAFIVHDNGNEYSKNFFDQGSYPGSMRALLLSEPSQFTIDALEASVVIEIDFSAYRYLLTQHHDLASFHIAYLEDRWVISKERNEIDIVMEDATERYMKFLQEHPNLQGRIQQYHLASHLGITPTQLSRIRKKIAQINLCK